MLTLEGHLTDIGWEVTDSGCWEWSGSRSDKRGGYGQLNHGGRVLKAHRVAYSLWIGDPTGMFVCHTCDSPPCVNPSHLFLGTVADNVADMRAKGRGFDIPAMPGELSPSAKLREVDLWEIRNQLERGASQASIAREYGVTRQCIHRIKKGRTWKTIQ